VFFNASALRYAISKCCFHAVAALQRTATEPSNTSSSATPFSAASSSPVFTQTVLDVGPQLWSLLLLSLPLLHARALVGELAGAASDYAAASSLLATSPQAFKQRFNAAAATRFPPLHHRPPGANAGVDALGHFQRFFRAYYDQVSKKPEQVVQYALTFPSGTSHCAKLTSPIIISYFIIIFIIIILTIIIIIIIIIIMIIIIFVIIILL
jgi:hypothetical protein